MIYFGNWKDIKNDDWSVEFDTDPSSVRKQQKELYLSYPACTIEMVGQEDNIYKPVLYTGATVNLHVNDLVMDLYSATPKSITVQIKRNGTLIFDGYVTPCMYSQKYEYGSEISIECVDKLSILEYIEYKPSTFGIKSFDSIIRYIMTEAGLDIETTAISMSHNITINGSSNIFQQLYVSDYNFVGDNENWTCKDVLEALMQYTTLTASLQGNMIYIINYDILQNHPIVMDKTKYAGGDINISLTPVCSKVKITTKTNKVDGLIDLFNEKYLNTVSDVLTLTTPNNSPDEHLGSNGTEKQYMSGTWIFYTNDKYETKCWMPTYTSKKYIDGQGFEHSNANYYTTLTDMGVPTYDLKWASGLGTDTFMWAKQDGYYNFINDNTLYMNNCIGSILLQHSVKQDKDFNKIQTKSEAKPAFSNYLLLYCNNFIPERTSAQHLVQDLPILFATKYDSNPFILADMTVENKTLNLLISGTISVNDRFNFYTKPSSYGRRKDKLSTSTSIYLPYILYAGNKILCENGCYVTNKSTGSTEYQRGWIDLTKYTLSGSHYYYNYNKLYFDVYKDDDFLGKDIEIKNTVDWRNEYLEGKAGYKIPLKGIDMNDLNSLRFEILAPKERFDNDYYICDIWVKDLKLELVTGQEFRPTDKTNYQDNNSDTEYIGEIYQNAIEEFSDIEFKIHTFDNKNLCYSSAATLNNNGGYSFDVKLKDNSLNVTDIPERLLISKIVNQYYKPKTILDLTYDGILMPTAQITWNTGDFNGKTFIVNSQKLNCNTLQNEIKIIEK